MTLLVYDGTLDGFLTAIFHGFTLKGQCYDIVRETADESLQQWWCITREGEMLSTGADQTPITDGEQYELTLTEGY